MEVSADLFYQKQSLRNRYSVLGVNGLIWLTVPVGSTQGIRTSFRDIRIAGNTWRKVHWRTLQSSYARSAYWEHYSNSLQRIFFQEQTFLLDLHLEIMQWMSTIGIERINSRLHRISYEPFNDDIWEPSYMWPPQASYPQVFSDRHSFQPNLSIIDLIMNLGPKSEIYLNQVSV